MQSLKPPACKCTSGCTLDEYVRKCRQVDDTDFSVSPKQVRRVHFDEFNEIHTSFLTKFEQENGSQGINSLVAIQRMSLKGRGKANQLIFPRVPGKTEGSFLLQVQDDACWVMSIEKIMGATDENMNVSYVSCYGPVWEIFRNDDVYEVFEFNARQHFRGRRWWSLDEISLPCWVRHIHRFPEGDVSNFCQSLTDQSASIFNHCRFDIACHEHDDRRENFCEDCLRILTRGRHAPGTDGYVIQIKTWGDVRLCFISALGCRNFERILGSLTCPQLHSIIGAVHQMPLRNLWFRVYYGNSGYMPSLFQRRDPDWDQDLATHLSRSFIV